MVPSIRELRSIKVILQTGFIETDTFIFFHVVKVSLVQKEKVITRH